MRKSIKLISLMVVSLVFMNGLTACGFLGAPKAETEEEILLGQSGRTMWESSLQYVKIVSVDIAGTVNNQPASISSDDLRTVLDALYVSESIMLNTQENPLFTLAERQILSAAISNGLNQAQPNEDVTFVSIGFHPTALAKERKSTTGRVFMSGGGQLNIVFKDIHKQFTDIDQYTGQKIDRRTNPLIPGSRNSASSLPDAKLILDKGQSLYLDPNTGKERSDWLVIDIATVIATMRSRANNAGDGTISPALLEDIARSKQETKNLRHDISGMKEIMFDMSDEIDRLNKQIEALKAAE